MANGDNVVDHGLQGADGTAPVKETSKRQRQEKEETKRKITKKSPGHKIRKFIYFREFPRKVFLFIVHEFSLFVYLFLFFPPLLSGL